ncbi:hypothetical protein Tco_1568711 [Tanacetum coccineum]
MKWENDDYICRGTSKRMMKFAIWSGACEFGCKKSFCKDLHWFQVCKSIEDGSFEKMGNVATEPIKGIGRVF